MVGKVSALAWKKSAKIQEVELQESKILEKKQYEIIALHADMCQISSDLQFCCVEMTNLYQIYYYWCQIHQSSGNVFTEPEMFMELENLSEIQPCCGSSLDECGWKFGGKNHWGYWEASMKHTRRHEFHEFGETFSWIADKGIFVRSDKARYP